MSVDISKASVSQLQSESDRLTSLIGEMETQLADARTLLGRVRSELEKRLRPADKPMITDHALLRYIERVHGVDVETLKAHIMAPNVVAAIQAGASSVTKDGVKFIIKGQALVTAIDTASVKNKPKKVHKGRAENGSGWQQQVDEYHEDREP